MAIHGRPDNASSEVNGGYFASSSGEATTQRGTSASSTDTVAGSTSAPTRIAQSILSLRKSTVLSFSIHSTDSCGWRCRNATSGASSCCWPNAWGARTRKNAHRPIVGNTQVILQRQPGVHHLTGVTITKRSPSSVSFIAWWCAGSA